MGRRALCGLEGTSVAASGMSRASPPQAGPRRRMQERNYRDISRHPASCSCVICVEARAAGRISGATASKRKKGKKANSRGEQSARRRSQAVRDWRDKERSSRNKPPLSQSLKPAETGGQSTDSLSSAQSGIFKEVDQILGGNSKSQKNNVAGDSKKKRRRKKRRKR